MGVTIHTIGVGSDPAMERSFKELAVNRGEFLPLRKVDALIDRILTLLCSELIKVAQDIDVFGAWATAEDRSAEGLAIMLGRPAAGVGESLKRLRAKGVLPADDAAAAAFRWMQ